MKLDRRAFLGAAGLSALSAAGRSSFGALIEPGSLDRSGDAQTRARPLTAGRWAMVIDVQKCLRRPDCTACTSACHKAHNVPESVDAAHEIKWIWKEPFERAFPSEQYAYPVDTLREAPVLVLCNHCNAPPCVRVCPTGATWRRQDGVVMMDSHRCIGCRYCVAACPYGSRSFNWSDPRRQLRSLNPDYPTRTKGVVEKCTFCEERLATGRMPACADACPDGAIICGDLGDASSTVRTALRARYSVRRKAGLGTEPGVYYLV
jgi:Fe-S-cluster-containing dehydrogenase component